jgi:ABC-type glycerol-3-phosphate transport system substrate-binding protein
MPGRLSRRRLVGSIGLGLFASCLAACQSAPPPAPTAAPAQPAAPAAGAAAKPGPEGSPAAKPAGETKPSLAATPPGALTAAPPAKPLEKATIRLWHWDSFLIEPYEKEALDFTRKFPEVTVKVELTPSGEYMQKLTAAIAGGVPPDLPGISVHGAYNFVVVASNGQLTALEPYLQRDKFDLEDFYKINLRQHYWMGKIYSLPYAWNTQIWFYNQDLFAREKVKTPTEHWREGTWTWDTYLETSAKLTRGSGTDRQWGSSNLAPTNTAAFFPMIWSNGGQLFDAGYTRPSITEPASIEAYQFFYNIRKHAPGPEDAKTGTVESGKLGMWPNWDIWYLLNLDKVPFKYSIVPPPASTRTKSTVFYGNAPGFGITKAGKYQDQSWELLKFVLSPESLTRLFLAANNTPSRRSLAETLDLWKKNTRLPDPGLMAEIAKLKEKGAKNPPKPSNWPEMLNAHGEELSLVWADKQALDAGVKKVDERWAKLLKEAQIDKDAE